MAVVVNHRHQSIPIAAHVEDRERCNVIRAPECGFGLSHHGAAPLHCLVFRTVRRQSGAAQFDRNRPGAVTGPVVRALKSEPGRSGRLDPLGELLAEGEQVIKVAGSKGEDPIEVQHAVLMGDEIA